MNVGDRISAQPVTFGEDMAIPQDKGFVKRRKNYPGTVTYIHPKGRWYQVTFDIGIRECFFVDVEPTPLIRDAKLYYKGAFP